MCARILFFVSVFYLLHFSLSVFILHSFAHSTKLLLLYHYIFVNSTNIHCVCCGCGPPLWVSNKTNAADPNHRLSSTRKHACKQNWVSEKHSVVALCWQPRFDYYYSAISFQFWHRNRRRRGTGAIGMLQKKFSLRSTQAKSFLISTNSWIVHVSCPFAATLLAAENRRNENENFHSTTAQMYKCTEWNNANCLCSMLSMRLIISV